MSDAVSFFRRRSVIAGPALLFAMALAICSVLVVTNSSAHGQEPLVSTSPADISAGELLYQAHCQSCHGYQGQGGQTGAPELVNAGAAAADFYLSTGRMPLNNPANEPLRHHPYFDPTQIRQLVAYINALPQITGTNATGPTITTVLPQCTTAVAPNPNPTNCVTLSEGQLYFAQNCAQCHQATGAGGMLSKGTVIPSLHNANLTQILEALRIGPKPMPVFSTAELSEQQASAIAHYVEYLHGNANPGGLPISHFGPVAEGFVGILAGFGILWFAARMIGTRG
jgi:ubiquinol-cytochrome c reductase cytochrome c subunit